MKEDMIRDIISIRENGGWFAQFHKLFRVGDFTKDGLSESFLYELIAKDLHLYPYKRNNPKVEVTDEEYAKYLVEFVKSIGSEALINTFTKVLSYTIEEMTEYFKEEKK